MNEYSRILPGEQQTALRTTLRNVETLEEKTLHMLYGCHLFLKKERSMVIQISTVDADVNKEGLTRKEHEEFSEVEEVFSSGLTCGLHECIHLSEFIQLT